MVLVDYSITDTYTQVSEPRCRLARPQGLERVAITGPHCPSSQSGLEPSFRSPGLSGNNSSPSVPFLNPWHSAVFSTNTPSNHTWETLRPNSALKSTGDRIPRVELPSHGAGRKGWVEIPFIHYARPHLARPPALYPAPPGA